MRVCVCVYVRAQVDEETARLQDALVPNYNTRRKEFLFRIKCVCVCVCICVLYVCDVTRVHACVCG